VESKILLPLTNLVQLTHRSLTIKMFLLESYLNLLEHLHMMEAMTESN
jgi:hypothetical protein